VDPCYGRAVSVSAIHLAAPITASRADLASDVLATIDQPPASTDRTITADGIPFFVRTWGDPAAPPLLLLHGVTSNSRCWWRVGPALAASLGRHVLAPDQAGHGLTGHWNGRVAFRDNAVSIRSFVEAAELTPTALRVVGHSWGGMTAAWLPAVGVVPEVTVLLDPPAVPLAVISSMLDDPIERPYDDLTEAIRAMGALNPTWPYGDALAKAESLTQFDVAAVRAVLTENGDWDGGIAGLAEPAARDSLVRVVRGEVATGGLVPDAAAMAFAERLGPENVLTIADGAHSPMRLKIEATVLALTRALTP